MPALKKTPLILKPIPQHTFGKSVPKSGKRACFDPKTGTYTRKACGKDILLSQGIGVIEGVEDIYSRAFSRAFSSAFQ